MAPCPTAGRSLTDACVRRPAVGMAPLDRAGGRYAAEGRLHDTTRDSEVGGSGAVSGIPRERIGLSQKVRKSDLLDPP
jgi:hypothetical protein